MIKFGLVCEAKHRFEGWFGSSGEFERQSKRGFVTCPACGSDKVRKALMAPSVSTSRDRAAVASEVRGEVMNAHAQMLGHMRRLRDAVTANAEDVGPASPRRHARSITARRRRRRSMARRRRTRWRR